MTLEELKVKYPMFADILIVEPNHDCPSCGGTGEYESASKIGGVRPCFCTAGPSEETFLAWWTFRREFDLAVSAMALATLFVGEIPTEEPK